MGLKAKVYRQADMGGGLNTRAAPHLLAVSEALAMQNLSLSDARGMPKRRKGYTRYDVSSLTEPIRGQFRFYKRDGTKHLVSVSNGIVYKASGTTIDASTLGSGYSASKDFFFDAFNDLAFGVNGTDKVLRWDGAAGAVRDAGFPPPSTTLGDAAGAAGALTGTYKYKFTFVYDDISEESTASDESNGVTVTSQRVDLTSIDVGGAGVTKRNIYRTLAGGSIFYFLKTINNNVDTTYTDNAADGTLDTLNQAPTDNNLPPRAKYVAVFANRIFLANATLDYDGNTIDGKSRVFFSALTESEVSPNTIGTAPVHGAGGEIFPADFFFDVEDNDGDEIVGLGVTLDSLVIFKEKSVWRLIGDSPENFELIKADSDLGCISGKTIKRVENLLYFLAGGNKPSICATDGTRVIPIGERIQPTLQANIDRSAMESACAVQHLYTYVLIYKSITDSANSSGIIYDYIKDAWGTLTNIPANIFSSWNGSGDSGEVFFGSSVDGKMYQYDTGASDDGASIQSIWQSKFYDFGTGERRKVMKSIYSLFGAGGDNVTVDLLRDFNASPVAGETTSAVLTAEPTDGGVSKHRFVVPDTAQGHFYSLKYTSSGTGAFDLYGMAFYFDENEDGN